MEASSNSIVRIVTFIVCVCITTSCGLKCFDCRDSPYPRDCARVTTCSHGDVCFTETVVSTSGEVVYNTGCLPVQHCPANSTDKSAVKRHSDITMCIDCCSDDFCNNKGCGTSDIPRDKRGPYCYSCDATWKGHTCNKVTICPYNSVCATYTPKEFLYLPEVVFQSSCVSKSTCSSLTNSYSNRKCKPTCCDSDFCNVGCKDSSSIPTTGVHPNSPSSTPVPSRTTARTTTPATATPFMETTHSASLSTLLSSSSESVPAVPSSTMTPTTGKSNSTSLNDTAVVCPAGYIRDPISRLCIKIFRIPNRVSWYMAQSICSASGDTLVSIDNQHKMEFIHLMLNATESNQFWIGGRDQFDNSTFYWSNGQPFAYTYWASNVLLSQSYNSISKNCVGISVKESFRWNQNNCSDLMDAFICEHSLIETPMVKHFICDTYNGYEDIGSGLCLKMYRDKELSWQESRALCNREGTELIVLDTAVKYKTLEKYLDAHDTKRNFWIGGYDKFKDNRYFWVSEQPFTETDWYTYIDETGSFLYSQPDHFSPDHTPADCVVTFPSESTRHQWYDDVCSNTRNFICQRT